MSEPIEIMSLVSSTTDRVRRKPEPRIVLAIALIALASAAIVSRQIWPHELDACLATAIRTLRSLGAAGWLVAALAQIVIALCGILPASVGAATTGMLYGIAPGFLLSGSGTLIGAVLAFLLTRSLLRPFVLRAMARNPRIDRLDEAVASDGWRLVCLMRMSPVMPFAVTSYALGLTSLRLRDYLIGTLASLPALLCYVVLGDLAGTGLGAAGSAAARPIRLVVLAAAMAAVGLLILRLGRILARVLRLPDPVSRERTNENCL